MASRISALWNFTGPAFTVTAVETSAFKALEVAQMLLTTGEVDAVVVGAVDLAGGVENVLLRNQWTKINTGINTLSYDQKANGWMIGEGAGAVVLKPYEPAQQNGDGSGDGSASDSVNTSSDRIYAVIDAISFGQAHVDGGIVNQVCKQAFQIADIQPTEINYLEVCGSGIPQEDEAEITGLLQAYCQSENSQNCALGSVKANIGHTYVASGIASLIKTALCLHYRYIPATPNWSGVKTPQIWEGSPFYVPTESRPWFLGKDDTRIAAINSMGIDGSYAHLILSEEPNQQERSSKYLQQMPLYLFPIAADERSNLLKALDHLQQSIENSSSLSAAASQAFVTFEKRSQTKYTLAIAGRNKQELVKEIESARKGINSAFERNADWQTPLGSYFTAKPLGKTGAIAYVYPAAVNSYIGIARNLFRLFPKAFEDLKSNNLYNRATEVEKLVYPRSLNKLSTRQLENLEKQLLNDTQVMFEAEMFVTRLITTIIRDDFQVKPKYAFGYSLGEVSMMVAQGVWSNFYQGSNIFNSSALFGDRLSGPKNAVREYWKLPKTSSSTDNNFWSNYILIASPSQVRECLKHENRIYLTQINTPEEVVIAGETAACERLINTLGCNAFPAPFDYVIHCEVMRSEYEEIKKLNTLPSQNIPDIVFYSAANYQPITLESEAIARSIAKAECEQLDFPRLVNHVYDDGARIFIEAGAGGVCSRLINKILENKEHITVSLNRRGINDHTSIIKALAKLLSHQVDLDLSPLYSFAKETANQNTATLRTVTLGGNSITATILNDENRKLFQKIAGKVMHEPVAQHQTKIHVKDLEIINFPQTPSIINNDYFEIKEQSQSSQSNATQQKITQNVPHSVALSNYFSHPFTLSDFRKSHYQKLSANNSSINKTHAAFLEARHESSKQLSTMIQFQLSAIQNLLNQ